MGTDDAQQSCCGRCVERRGEYVLPDVVLDRLTYAPCETSKMEVRRDGLHLSLVERVGVP